MLALMVFGGRPVSVIVVEEEEEERSSRCFDRLRQTRTMEFCISPECFVFACHR
jgi:hypothetical protein